MSGVRVSVERKRALRTGPGVEIAECACSGDRAGLRSAGWCVSGPRIALGFSRLVRLSVPGAGPHAGPSCSWGWPSPSVALTAGAIGDRTCPRNRHDPRGSLPAFCVCCRSYPVVVSQGRQVQVVSARPWMRESTFRLDSLTTEMNHAVITASNLDHNAFEGSDWPSDWLRATRSILARPISSTPTNSPRCFADSSPSRVATVCFDDLSHVEFTR